MPIEAWLLERVGWRAALTTLAVVLAVTTIPIHALVLRRNLATATVRADGSTPSVPGMTLSQASRTLVFWVLAGAFFLSNFSTAAVSVHLIPYLVDQDYSATLAAAIIGWMGAMQVPGRMLFVPISVWLGARWMVASVFFGQAVGLGQLPLIALVGTALPFIIVMGASNGMSTLSRATSLAQIFGPRHYGAISGAVALGANSARAIGPVGASLLLLGLGSYPSVFWVLTASLVVASLAVLIAGAGVKPAE